MNREKAVAKLRLAKNDLMAEPGMYAKLGRLLDAPAIDWAQWAFLEECDSPADIIMYFKGQLQSTATPNIAELVRVTVKEQMWQQQLQAGRTCTAVSHQTVGQYLLATSEVVPGLHDTLANLPYNFTFAHVQGHLDAFIKESKAASNEQGVQKAYNQLFPCLKKATGANFFVHDTSKADFLKNPMAKVDFTFSANDVVSWSSVVWLAEAKLDLGKKDAYEEALGQASDWAQVLFKQQPHRSHCIVALLGGTSIEIVKIWNAFDRKHARSGIESVADASSAGTRLLLRLFYSQPLQHFNFLEESVPDISPLKKFKLLRRQRSPRGSSVFSAVMGSDPVVVKISDSVPHEVTVLEWLAKAGVERVPRVVTVGVSPGFGLYMVIKPYGEHLGSDTPPVVVAQVVLDVAESLCQAAQAGVLHRDVSAMNIVQHEVRGHLIDFHVASMAGNPGSAVVTGTLLFSAVSVLAGGPNTLSSDLESLLYSLIYIASDGKVPGRHVAYSLSLVCSDKLTHMLMPIKFDAVLQQCTPVLRPLVEQLRNLFFKEIGQPAATSYLYSPTVEAQDFVSVCMEELTCLRQAAQGPTQSPRQGFVAAAHHQATGAAREGEGEGELSGSSPDSPSDSKRAERTQGDCSARCLPRARGKHSFGRRQQQSLVTRRVPCCVRTTVLPVPRHAVASTRLVPMPMAVRLA